MTPETLVILGGLHSLGFALFHVGFWKLFGWPRTLRDTNAVNRGVLQIANVQLVWVFLLAAGLCLLFPHELASTPHGQAFLLGMSLFWILRLVVQFVWLRIDHPLVHALSLLFALGALLFALPLAL